MTTNVLNHTVLMDDLSANEEFITAAEFEDATRTVVRTIGQNDCDIIFAGNGAKTNGKVVTLPAQDPQKPMTRAQYAVGQGYANHETMHNLCTDLDFTTVEYKRLKQEGKKLALACANALEDVRIERAAAKLYPGIPSQITSTADYAAKKFMEEYLPDDPDMVKSFKRIGPIAITWRGRQRMGYESPYIDKCLAELDPDMLAKIDKWCSMIENLPTGATGPGEFDKAKSFEGSRQGLKLAELLAKEIEEAEDDDDQDGDGNEGEPGDGDEDGEGEGNPGVGGRGLSRFKEFDPVDPDFTSPVMNLLNSGQANSSYRPVSTAMDIVCKRSSASPTIQSMINDKARGNAGYSQTMSELGSKTAVMKRKLERALFTMSDTDYVSGQRQGRLDVRRKGVAIMSGRDNIFRKKIDGKEIDTAVTILVDVSGSMSGQKMKLAAQVCTALAECFEKTTVQLEVLCFSTMQMNDAFPDHIVTAHNQIISDVRHDSSLSRAFHRCDSICLWEIKAFEDSLREARVSLGCMRNLAHGANADGDSILMAAKRLKKQKAGKHILLVLSDGQPAYGYVSGNPHDFTKMCADYVTKMGIHSIGIGIMSDAVKQFYKNNAVVNDLSDLDKAVMDKIARHIIGEDFRVDNSDLTMAAANYKKAS